MVYGIKNCIISSHNMQELLQLCDAIILGQIWRIRACRPQWRYAMSLRGAAGYAAENYSTCAVGNWVKINDICQIKHNMPPLSQQFLAGLIDRVGVYRADAFSGGIHQAMGSQIVNVSWQSIWCGVDCRQGLQHKYAVIGAGQAHPVAWELAPNKQAWAHCCCSNIVCQDRKSPIADIGRW